MNKGERAIAIDEVDLNWCFQPGVKLDFRHFRMDTSLRQATWKQNGKNKTHLKPLEIVVVNTRAGSRYGSDDYVSAGCGMGYEAPCTCSSGGVAPHRHRTPGAGTRPFVYTAEKYKGNEGCQPDLGRAQGRARHRLLPPREAAQSRGAPGDGFVVSCFPAQDPRRLRPAGRAPLHFRRPPDAKLSRQD
jgi:hypothetical protein